VYIIYLSHKNIVRQIFCSGEANDIALQLARRYTKKTDVAVVEGSFHGAVLTLTNVAVRAFRVSSGMQNPWVHVVPCPILGGNADDNAEEAIRVMEEAKRNQKQVRTSCLWFRW